VSAPEPAPSLEPGDRRAATRRDPVDLLALPPLRAVLRLATPTTFVMVLATATNVLYTYFVSRLGAEAIAAVSLVFPIALLAGTAMNGGLGGGAASAIARSLGAGRTRHAAEISEHAIALALAIGVTFGLVMAVGGTTVFRMMGGDGAVLDLAVSFSRITFGGAVVTFFGGMLDSVLRGEGNVRVSAIWSSVSLALQMVLTPICMFTLGFGLPGAAIALIGSQALACIPRARFVFGGGGLVHPAPWPRRVHATPLGEILRVGVPASLSTIINYAGLMILTGVVARLGTAHLAAWGLCTRFDFLLMSFAFGFATAVLTLVGLTTGARRPERARVYVARAGGFIVALLSVPAAILWWRPSLWLGLFSQDPEIHAVGAQYFRLVGPSYPFVAVSMVLAFAFQGLGRAMIPLAWMSVRVLAVLGISIFCTQRLGLGERAVFATIAAGNVTSAVVMVTLFRATERRIRRAAAA
jgi:putative MATE family efflux protein